MKAVKGIGKTIIAIIIVILLVITCWLFGYLKDNVWINYYFPYLSYHVFAALFYSIVVSAYFSESSKDVLSTIIGLCISGLLAYFEYTQFVAAGAGQAVLTITKLTVPDNVLRIVYGVGLTLGVIKTFLDLYTRFRWNFSNERASSATANEQRPTIQVVNSTKETSKNQETNNEVSKDDHTS